MPDPNAVTAAPQTQLVKKNRRKYKQVNRKAGSPRKGQRYKTVTRKGGDVVHVYADGTVIGKGVGKGTKKPSKNKGRGSTPSTYDPFAPLDARGLRREVNTRTAMEYDPQFKQIGAERRISDQSQSNISSWFANYQKTIAQAQQVQAQQSAQLQQQIAGNAQQAYQGDIQGQQQLQAQQQAGAVNRGVQANPAVIQAGQQAAAARQSQQGSLASMQGIIGQNAANYMGTQRVAAGQGELQAHERETKNRGAIEQARRDLLKERGQYKTKTRADIVEKERGYKLEQAAFGLDVAKEQNDAAQAAEDDRLSRQRERRLRREGRQREADRVADNRRADRAEARMQANADWDKAHPNAKSGGGKGPGGTFTPTQLRNNRKAFRVLIGHGRSGASEPPKNSDPLMLTAAAQIVSQGYVDRATARKMKIAYGFTPKTKGRGGHPSTGQRS